MILVHAWHGFGHCHSIVLVFAMVLFWFLPWCGFGSCHGVVLVLAAAWFWFLLRYNYGSMHLSKRKLFLVLNFMQIHEELAAPPDPPWQPL